MPRICNTLSGNVVSFHQQLKHVSFSDHFLTLFSDQFMSSFIVTLYLTRRYYLLFIQIRLDLKILTAYV